MIWVILKIMLYIWVVFVLAKIMKDIDNHKK